MTSIRAMASDLGVHPSTVMRRLDRGADPALAASPRAGVPCPATGRAVPLDPTEAEIIRNGAQSGMKNIEIARELGVSRATVYRRAAKIGVEVRRGSLHHADTLRRAVQEMSRDEAIEYLLEVVEQIAAQDEPLQRNVGGATLTPQQAIIFALLNRRIGRPVSIETILAVLDAGKADATGSRVLVRSQVSHIRRKLAGKYRILTRYMEGYVLEAVAQPPIQPEPQRLAHG